MDLTGKLLVALPMLVDPNFARTVVLLLSHGEEGSIGLVLNRPSTVDLAEPLPRWSPVAASPAVVFEGGPVQPDMAIALGHDGDVIATVDLDDDPTLLPVREVRVFAGYAGWSAGQLEDELSEGAWTVCESVPGDAFSPDAADLWYAVLGRQRNELARLALLPDDIHVN